MTLIKSLLLGSAAGIVAVASAQAADLPTRKGAPAAEYVRICSINVGGKPVVGFVLPGSDTCFKISGYITGQIEGGNLNTGYSLSYAPTGPTSITNGAGPTLATGGAGVTSPGFLVPQGYVANATAAGVPTASTVGQTNTGTTLRPNIGWTTRENLTIDAVSNTSAGPLVAHGELQFNQGDGFDNTGSGGSDGGLNRAYVTWAGITAGKVDSFFSFTGGGAGWANFFSPDQKGFNQPDQIAYTASFGGGASATISLQDPAYDNITNLGANYTYNGMRAPDVVANLKITQAWGSAGISGVAHEVRATSYAATSQDTWGWGIDAGISFNLPTGPGDQFMLTGAYSRNAIRYSGLVDAMWGEDGAVNGNGQAMALADTYYNGVGWQTPTAWSITAELDHTFTPEFSASLEGSYGGVNWDGSIPTSVVTNATTWLAGIVGHYDPVKNLDFEVEVLYQGTNNSTPPLFATTGTPFSGNADGFAARFEVTRSW